MRTSFKTLLFFVFLSTILFSQTSGNDIRAKVLSTIPNIDMENKILFINLWKSSDFESRQNTKEFNRVANIYKEGKLKNGLKGVCFVNISLDDNTQAWRISIQKDEIQTEYNLENTDGKYTSIVQMMDSKVGSVVVNSAGQVLAKDMKKDACFPLFLSQITR